MGEVTPLQNNFATGIRRDTSRNQLPAQALWDSIDMLLNYGTALRQRGGWINHSQDISSVTGTASYIRGGCFANFATSGGGVDKNVAVDEDGRIYNVTTEGAASSIGAGVTIGQNPIFHGGTAVSAASAVYTGLMIFPDATGAAVPKKYDGTTLSNLGGTPPKARFASVYKDYTVLGNGTVGSTYYPNRTWFSPEGDPDCGFSSVTAWDTTDSWIDLSQEVKGYGTNQSVLLVFHDEQVSRIRGAIPPPDEDMIVDDGKFKVGLLDPFSIVEHRDSIIFASPEGVFRTDGVSLDDLTKRGGFLRYWLDLTRDADSTWTFAAGAHRDNYILTAMEGTTVVDTLFVDLQTLAWTRHSNFDATSYWNGFDGVADELFWGRRGAARVCRLSPIFDVGTATADGDGDPILPVVETSFFPVGKPGPKRMRRAYFSHEITDFASDEPTCAVSFITTPEETSYTAIGSLEATERYERVRLPVNRQGVGVGFKFERAGEGDFLLYEIAIEAWEQDSTRLIP